jgi:aminopeptidase N
MAQLTPEEEEQYAWPLRHQPHGVIGLIIVLGLFMAVMYWISHRSPASDGAESTPVEPAPTIGVDAVEVDTVDVPLDQAVSEPIEDSVYPAVGDPGVDALHYALTLDWQPETRTLTGEALVTFRATEDADRFQLDLIPELEVSSVRLNGAAVDFTHSGKDLVVTAEVAQDQEYGAIIAYSGTPQPVEAPTTRADIDTLGWHITDAGETWTMQEPFGAYSWYPVNDQPADKAFYDFSLSVPTPMVGVANGELISREEVDGVSTTRWSLDEPASSYLSTVAFGEFTMVEEESASGTPLSYWVPAAEPSAASDLKKLAPLLRWAEARLGPYPFSTLGIVLVDSESAMETQTMVTLGNNPYIRSDEVILHELIHQWYGDQVTPLDWRDVWMNEGMTMYLQGVYEAEQEGRSVNAKMRDWAEYETAARAEDGPPGDYDPENFGRNNIYFGPALMWHTLRRDIGNKRFWSLVRDWPAAHNEGSSSQGELSGSADRDTYYAWIEDHTGEELSAFFDAWIMGAKTPQG